MDITNEQAEELGRIMRDEDKAEKREVQRTRREAEAKQEETKRGEKRVRNPDNEANANAEHDE